MSDPLSIATGLIALIQVTAKANEYLKNVRDGGKERTKLRDELRSVTCLLEMLHDRVEDDQHEASSENNGNNDLKPAAVASLTGPDGPLERMKATMEDIVAQLAPQSGLRRLVQPIKWPFDKKDMMELFSTIERTKSHITLVLQNDLMYALAHSDTCQYCLGILGVFANANEGSVQAHPSEGRSHQQATR